MTSADAATIDAAMRIIRDMGKKLDCDTTVDIRYDGRVTFYFERTLNGYLKDTARAVLDSDGSLPEPGEALRDLARRHE